MKQIHVIPLIGFDNVTFGMKREQVHQLLGTASEFKKSLFSSNTTDNYGFCHIFYNANDECEAVEFFPGIELCIGTAVLLPGDFQNIQKLFPDLQDADGCFISKTKSIGVSITDGTIDSILFGCTGYYA